MEAALHLWIADLLSGNIIQMQDQPTGISLPSGQTAYRVRLYGTVVSTNELVIDDGTGSILIRTFDKPFNLNIGDPVLVIGRPRSYNGTIYLAGDIAKKTDPKWMELIKKQHPYREKKDAITLVRELDSGEGASYDEVVKRLGEKGEETVVHLLTIGEIFETKPGRLKVLE